MQTISKEALWISIQEAQTASSHTSPAIGAGDDFPEPDAAAEDVLDMAELESALQSLSPDCDERTWACHRIAPLANAALEYPEKAGELLALAIRFSSGKLSGKASLTWTKRGDHGSPRRGRISDVWKRFQRSKFKGNKAGLPSIFFHARQEGWVYVAMDQGVQE